LLDKGASHKPLAGVSIAQGRFEAHHKKTKDVYQPEKLLQKPPATGAGHHVEIICRLHNYLEKRRAQSAERIVSSE
jgi:hypothetical protein